MFERAGPVGVADMRTSCAIKMHSPAQITDGNGNDKVLLYSGTNTLPFGNSIQ